MDQNSTNQLPLVDSVVVAGEELRMHRPLVLLAFVLVMLGGMFGGAGRSIAQDGTATPEPSPPADICPVATPAASGADQPWLDQVDVRPPQSDAAFTVPLDMTDDPADVEGPRHFYLVVWTLRPGTCVPYEAPANMKDGAVILLVQQGIIEYTWQQYEGSNAEVFSGRTALVAPARPVDPGTTVTLYPGDWVVQNDQTWFTFTSVGGESAVVAKAVFTKPPVSIGCSGSCR